MGNECFKDKKNQSGMKLLRSLSRLNINDLDDEVTQAAKVSLSEIKREQMREESGQKITLMVECS